MIKHLSLICYGLLVFILVSQIQACSSSSGTCNDITTVAQDIKKINYLKNWIEHKIKQDEFLQEMGWNGRMRRISLEKAKKLNFDLDFLGFSPGNAGISLVRNHKDRDDYMNPKNIKAVVFRDGRDSIIIRMNQSSSFGAVIEKKIKVGLIKINDDVYVSCDSKRKRHNK